MAMHLTTFSPKCCCIQGSEFDARYDIQFCGSYGNLEDQLVPTVVGFQGIEDRG